MRAIAELSQDEFIARIAAKFPDEPMWSRQTQSDIETGKIVLSEHDANRIALTFAEALTEAK